jgi:hypothetical protein
MVDDKCLGFFNAKRLFQFESKRFSQLWWNLGFVLICKRNIMEASFAPVMNFDHWTGPVCTGQDIGRILHGIVAGKGLNIQHSDVRSISKQWAPTSWWSLGIILIYQPQLWLPPKTK